VGLHAELSLQGPDDSPGHLGSGGDDPQVMPFGIAWPKLLSSRDFEGIFEQESAFLVFAAALFGVSSDVVETYPTRVDALRVASNSQPRRILD
jgi:hypothetical protein